MPTSRPKLVEQLQGAVTHAMAATGSPGAIVGVWAPWSGAWVAGLGTRQPAGAGGAVSADQQFKAAQVTRAMTCDVLYTLAARGTVSLDDPVTEYVSGVADLSQVTLGQLCDGTAGIGTYSGQLLATWLSKPDRVWNPRELASYGLGVGRTAPGSGVPRLRRELRPARGGARARLGVVGSRSSSTSTSPIRSR